MITAVDTNVLLDVFGADTRHQPASLDALRKASGLGRLVICEMVFAELSQPFETYSHLKSVLTSLDIAVEPVGEEGCYLAGRVFRKYRQAGGKKERMLADFLTGAHAELRCGRLLTRDRGYYRTYFPRLDVIDPSHP